MGQFQTKSILFLFVIVLTFLQCAEKENTNDLLLPLLALPLTNSSSVGPCPPTTLPTTIPIATTVVSANSTVSGFNDSSKAVNGICGGGEFSGSLDVYALNLTGAGATMILSWAGKTVKNVAGVDFVVYENPFKVSETSDRYAFDPMVVQVSFDGTNYCGFDLSGFNPSVADSNKISSWPGFGGLRPVLYNMATKPLTLNELFTSTGSGFLLGGGDGFNLDDLIVGGPGANCDSTARSYIQTNGFKFIKMISASAVTNPNTSAGYVYPHSYNNGPDIDGVVAKSVE
ncbi:LIC_13355 family lipoprotein [Leptospira kanakyensis]|uniref:LIC_13355 family lipoprotein n=1 Tax=Leptospira kanakyensis TaxID=2484968 RepID=A0A6N4QCY6_9LEPT|nr:LIC_13355 family lipoprotein [Leptospira kanakyensis]MCW7479519.1 LIC_13355 family lipoprotein [Leptospira kanakyensis]TGK51586.1 LIC_13355 family lipoprotein [Leptospira kanakyensis]TGK58713.1 LIC_13355 family lipoprotein [Leptospira kanakyensis]TGK70916.1 LIC_13355 family lipoprotein [Leptospira kanakyensis]